AIAAGALLIALGAPVAIFSLTGQGRQRFSDVSIMTRPDVAGGGPWRAAVAAGSNYLSYFSPGFLLTEGDPNLRHSIRGHGMLHPHDVALLAIGVAAALLMRGRGSLFALWWLAAYPVAASLTADSRHAVRAICALPGLYAIEGIGAAWIWDAAGERGVTHVG